MSILFDTAWKFGCCDRPALFEGDGCTKSGEGFESASPLGCRALLGVLEDRPEAGVDDSEFLEECPRFREDAGDDIVEVEDLSDLVGRRVVMLKRDRKRRRVEGVDACKVVSWRALPSFQSQPSRSQELTGLLRGDRSLTSVAIYTMSA